MDTVPNKNDSGELSTNCAVDDETKNDKYADGEVDDPYKFLWGTNFNADNFNEFISDWGDTENEL